MSDVISKFINLLKINGFNIFSGNELVITLERHLRLIDDMPSYKISKIKIHKEIRNSSKTSKIYYMALVEVDIPSSLIIFMSQDLDNDYFAYESAWKEDVLKYELLLGKFEQMQYLSDFIY